MANLGPNAELIGQAKALEQLYTPALIIELDAFERNLARMASYSRDHGVGLRPHAKTHKSVEIARRQVAAGALGVCCATLGEAEVMAAGGIDHVLLTTPPVGPRKMRRFLDLSAKSVGLMTVLDNADHTQDLADAAAALNLKVDVLVALDIGTQRIGARPEQAMAIARLIALSPNLSFRGVHAYCGSLQHIHDFSERKRAVVAANEIVRSLISDLDSAGLSPEIVTGVGTGSHQIDASHGTYTEMQVGSYIFMDVEYAEIDWPDGAFEQALFVATTVVSNNHRGFVTTDGGTKRFSMGGAEPRFADQDHWSYGFQGDEHGKIIFGEHNDVPQFGSLVRMIPPHCDPTVNLYDYYHVIRDGQLVDIWPIEARGAI
ncbi:MAG: DSD1 family PLP-dependent enzyme [Rhodospirillales bacterium]|nr:DSD1 family PLP-dependent enzyme [Rhodospirillales bacterium]